MAKENVITKIGQLLRLGQANDADALIVGESNRVESQIADLKKKIAILESALSTLHDLMPEGGQQSLIEGSARALTPVKLTKSQKQIRRLLVPTPTRRWRTQLRSGNRKRWKQTRSLTARTI